MKNWMSVCISLLTIMCIFIFSQFLFGIIGISKWFFLHNYLWWIKNGRLWAKFIFAYQFKLVKTTCRIRFCGRVLPAFKSIYKRCSLWIKIVSNQFGFSFGFWVKCYMQKRHGDKAASKGTTFKKLSIKNS